MRNYLNLGGNSSVIGYEYGYDSITVYFGTARKPYTYSYSSAGVENVETMKKLADRGYGLCSFIQRNVRYCYER